MDILSVQKEVIETLENRNSLAPLSEEEFRHILLDGGSMVGVFADERLIAFRAMLVPGDDHEHLGHDIGRDSIGTSFYYLSRNLQCVAVLPGEYRSEASAGTF